MEAGSQPYRPANRLAVMEDESEKRPRAEHVGRSKFLTPVLKPSPVCAHHDRKHGANAEWSWVRCMSCHQIEQIPKMEISKMEEWNSVMIYRKPDYVTPMAKKAEKSEKKKAPSRPTPSTPTSSTVPPLPLQRMGKGRQMDGPPVMEIGNPSGPR